MGYERVVSAWRPLLGALPQGQPRTEILRLFLASIIQEILQVQFAVADDDVDPISARGYVRRVVERKEDTMTKPGPALAFWMRHRRLLDRLPYDRNWLSDIAPEGVNEADWRKLRRIQELAVESAQVLIDSCFAGIYRQCPEVRPVRGGSHSSLGTWHYSQPCHIEKGRGRKKLLYLTVSWWWRDSDDHWLIVPSVQVWRKTNRGSEPEDHSRIADRLRRLKIVTSPAEPFAEWMRGSNDANRDVPLAMFPVAVDDDLAAIVSKVVASVEMFVEKGSVAWQAGSGAD